MKNKLFVLSGVVLSFVPIVVLAQVGFEGAAVTDCDLSELGGWLCKFGQLLGAIIPVLIALAVLFFVWGVVQFVIGNDEEAKARGKDKIIYGLIGLAVIIGMWGLVGVLQKTFGLSNTGTFQLPTVPVEDSSGN